MQIIRNREIVEDPWRHEPLDGDKIPVDLSPGDVTVPAAWWVKQRGALRTHQGRLGVRLLPEDNVEALAPDLDALALIAIVFPDAKEGRGYSQARILREHFGFAGELRAMGDVSRDRMAFMARCGIDAFALRPGEDAHAALATLNTEFVPFQPAADGAHAASVRRGLRQPANA